MKNMRKPSLRDDSIEENQRKSKDSSMIWTENSFSSISALESSENKHQFYPDFFNSYQWINENFLGNTV